MKVVSIICSLFLLGCTQNYNNEFFVSKNNLLNEHSRFNLVVFLSEKDCVACLNEISVFNDLYTDIASQNLTVIGIIDNNTMSDINQHAQMSTIKFPVVNDQKLFNRYSSGFTPEVFLIDMSKQQRVVFRAFNKKTISSQKALYDIVDTIVRNQY